MRKLLSLGVLALFFGATPTPLAASGVQMSFGFGFSGHFSFRFDCPRICCGPVCSPCPSYIAVFPGFESCQVASQGAFPPQPSAEQAAPGGGGRKPDDTVQWGYPNLNYTYHRPVSYSHGPPQAQQYPAQQYYPPQYYYPQSYSTPNYYPAQGITFDR